MKCLKSSALVTLAALGVVAMAASAQAVVVTTGIHGTLECSKTSGLTASFNSKGVLQNSSSISTVSVVCPVRRFFFDETPDIWVAVSDNSSVGAITCKAVAVNNFGSAESVGATSSSTGGGQWMNLAAPATNYTTGSYQIRCSIPKRGTGDASSTISTIFVNEENGVTP